MACMLSFLDKIAGPPANSMVTAKVQACVSRSTCVPQRKHQTPISLLVPLRQKMGENNTPPVSPSPIVDSSQHNGDDSDSDDLNPDNIVEVIELDDDDEGQEYGSGEEQGLEEMEDQEGEADPGIVFVEPERDDAFKVFSKHEGSVFCCDIEPKENLLAVSGAEDDKAYVWNTSTGDVLFECPDHKDSVIGTAFSHDGTYVATADMSGFVQIWKTASGSKVWEFEAGDLTWIRWHHGAHVLLAGAAAGEVWMWKIPSGDCKTMQSHGERAECGQILPDGRRAVVGYADGSVKFWDLKGGSPLHHMTGAFAHLAPVTSLDTHRDNVLVMTGGMDGAARLYNSQTGKMLAAFACSSEGISEDSPNSVESVAFCPDATLTLAATGTLKGDIALWDIPTQVQRQSFKQEGGVVKLIWAPNSSLLYSAGLDAVVRAWDARSGRFEKSWLGHSANILDMALGCVGQFLLTTSDDKTGRIFRL